jgi:hypothetical protein
MIRVEMTLVQYSACILLKFEKGEILTDTLDWRWVRGWGGGSEELMCAVNCSDSQANTQYKASKARRTKSAYM